ncbi:hypothetical protein N8467_01310, partial [bacterium]|nr:hypothetical protein [bacterium]
QNELPQTNRFRVPIHTAPDDPVGGAYGIWASGDTYKVSFHNGMEFHPVLGDKAPESLPVRWHTQSVRAGSVELMNKPTTTNFTDWRYEYNHGGVIEAYDVLPHGVEQTFVIPSAPAGAIVVEGSFASKLHAADRNPAHDAVQLCDANGKARVKYGAATVIDANGQTVAMTTEVDGDQVLLRLEQAEIASLTFPIVIDPLLATQTVGNLLNANSIWKPDVSRDDVNNEMMVAITRAVSISDWDVYVYNTQDDFTAPTIVFTDTTASWSTRNARCAFVGGAQRWTVAIEREFASYHAIRVHTRDTGFLGPDNSVSFLPTMAGASYTIPAIGGSEAWSTGDHALIVYQVDFTTTKANTDNSDVYGVLFDAVNETFGVESMVHPLAAVMVNGDRERPTVTKRSAGNGGSWIVAWQGYANNIQGDDWDIILAQVDDAGNTVGIEVAGDESSNNYHSITPKVAGRDGRYTLTYGHQWNNGIKFGDAAAEEIEAQRFNWSDGAPTATLGPRNSIRGPTFPRILNSGLAYDDTTRSHWCCVTSSDGNVYADRLGFRSGVAESVNVYAGPDYGDFPAVTFDNDAQEFAVVYIVDLINDPVFGVRFTYEAAATSAYGVGCGGTITADNGPPHAGHQFFSVKLSGAPAGAPAMLMIGTTSQAAPLGGFGMPGCELNTNIIWTFPAVADLAGEASITIPLPAPINGDLYAQYLIIDPAANPAGLVTTQGLEINVR